MLYELLFYAGAIAFATYVIAAVQPLLAVIFIRLRHIFF